MAARPLIFQTPAVFEFTCCKSTIPDKWWHPVLNCLYSQMQCLLETNGHFLL